MARTRYPAAARSVVVLAGLLGLGIASAHGGPPQANLPTWANVARVIEQHFAELPDYQPGGIITRSEARPLFAKLAALGWDVADREAILAAVPGDGDFLVKQLRSEKGRRFTDKIQNDPMAFDRTDRLSRLPRGKRMVEDLIRGPGGEKMIDYLTKSPGGAELMTMLSASPQGKDFAKPTGRLYTAAMLRDRLKAAYDAARHAAESDLPPM